MKDTVRQARQTLVSGFKKYRQKFFSPDAGKTKPAVNSSKLDPDPPEKSFVEPKEFVSSATKSSPPSVIYAAHDGGRAVEQRRQSEKMERIKNKRRTEPS